MPSHKHITSDAVASAIAAALIPGEGIAIEEGVGTVTIGTATADLTQRLDYPTLPGMIVRMYRNASFPGFPLTGGAFFNFDSGKIADMNDDDGGWAFERGEMADNGNAWAVVMIFPVPIPLSAAYVINQHGGSNTVYYSADSTNGADGTWVSTTAAGIHAGKTDFASPIDGVRAIGFQLYAEYFWNNFRFSEVRLWGAATDTINPGLLQLPVWATWS